MYAEWGYEPTSNGKGATYKYRVAIIEHEYAILKILFRTNSKNRLPGFIKCAEQQLAAMRRKDMRATFTLVTLECKV